MIIKQCWCVIIFSSPSLFNRIRTNECSLPSMVLEIRAIQLSTFISGVFQAEAMQIVKTIGQAFDVCHELQQTRDKKCGVLNSATAGANHGGPLPEASPGKPNYGSTLTTVPVSVAAMTTGRRRQNLVTSGSQDSVQHASSSSSPEDDAPMTVSRDPSTCHNIQRIKKSLSELNAPGRNGGFPPNLSGTSDTHSLHRQRLSFWLWRLKERTSRTIWHQKSFMSDHTVMPGRRQSGWLACRGKILYAKRPLNDSVIFG